MEKSPAVAYYARKIKTTNRLEIINELDEAPITRQDRYFMYDVLNGLTYKELAYKYNKTVSGVAQWKRRLFETMHRYDLRKV